jgi:2'-5' RNA ligase
MRRLRTFVALELGGSVISKARALQQVFEPTGAEVNWVEAANMHLTLKFLGDVPDIETADVCRVVAQATAEIEPFEIVFRGVGAFPDLDRPKTLWIGVDHGLEELRELHAAVDESLHRELGFGRENRNFTPHLTVGRIRHAPDLPQVAELLASLAEYDADLATVDEATIFASYLGRNGPTYEPLGHAPLEG